MTPEHLAERLAQLPHFFGYRDVLQRVCDGDEAVFLTLWCSGGFPAGVRQQIEESVAPVQVHTWWLMRVSQQLGDLSDLLRQGPPR